MSILSKASKGTKRLPRRIVLYGTRGIGKTSFASCAPNPIILDIERGSGDIDFPARLERGEHLNSFGDVMGAIGELLNDEHEHQTIVIDTLDWLEQLIWDAVCQAHNVESIEGIGFGKGYLFAVNHWRDLLAGLDALREHRGMTVILLAHSAIRKFESPDSDRYDRYEPKLDKHASAIIQDWCDEVLFANFKTYVKTEDTGFGRKRATGVGVGERVLKCTERPSHLAKNRLGMPDEIPLDWNEYAAFFAAPSEPAEVPAAAS